MCGAGTRNPVSVPQKRQGRERFEGAQGRAGGALSDSGKGKALRGAGHWERIPCRRRKDAGRNSLEEKEGWKGWGAQERGQNLRREECSSPDFLTPSIPSDFPCQELSHRDHPPGVEAGASGEASTRGHDPQVLLQILL